MTKSISSGKFITFEGVDGCGKSTQAEKLVEKLFEAKISAVTVREPGGDPISESIRKLLLQKSENHVEQYLFRRYFSSYYYSSYSYYSDNYVVDVFNILLDLKYNFLVEKRLQPSIILSPDS